MAISANRLELLQIADGRSRRRNSPSTPGVIVIGAMADAIQKAARSWVDSRNGQDTQHPHRTSIRRPARSSCKLADGTWSRRSGRSQCARSRSPMRGTANPDAQAGTSSPKLLPADGFRAHRPPSRPSRSSCRRCAKPNATGSSTSTRTGSARVVNGTVKRCRIRQRHRPISAGGAHGDHPPRRADPCARCSRYGDRCLLLRVYDVRREPARARRIFLSRTDPQFMANLFTMELPEI